ncbi:MAG: hypothetical protein ACPGVG_17035 [Mycobacterium sp.]
MTDPVLQRVEAGVAELNRLLTDSLVKTARLDEKVGHLARQIEVLQDENKERDERISSDRRTITERFSALERAPTSVVGSAESVVVKNQALSKLYLALAAAAGAAATAIASVAANAAGVLGG